jgi:DNA primase
MKFDVEEWCKDNLDNVKLTSTDQIVADCPWCNKSDHLYINRINGHYICFSCNEAGRHLIGIISQVEGISRSEARKFIMRNRVEFRRKETPKTLLDRISDRKQNNEDKVKATLPEEYIPVYKDGKWSFPVYLRERKIKRTTAREWKIGWARKGRYGGRIIIPIVCPNGVSFTSRDVTNEQEPKYLNPSGVNHRKLLLGWDKHPLKGDVVLVEGPMDAIKMWQHGFPSLALLGKVLHVEQLLLLATKPPDSSIIVMLDPEENTAPIQVAQQLISFFDEVYIAKLPKKVDPGASKRKQAGEAIDKATLYKGDRIGRLRSIISSSKSRLLKFYK